MDPKQRSAEWYKKNREEIIARRKAAFTSDPVRQERARKQQALWYKAHKELIKQKRKDYYLNHPEVHNALKIKKLQEKQKRRMKLTLHYKDLYTGTCSICGYNRNYSALEWHHIDPKEKSFNINKHGVEKKPAVILAELAKCMLICSNCHRELHNPEYDKLTHH